MRHDAMKPTTSWVWPILVAAAVCAGLGLQVDSLYRSSATYDEVTYLRVAARWWRTGDQESITRMGSPLTFWKLQQTPMLWLLDRLGRGDLIDDEAREAELLPLARLGSLWIWAACLLATAAWARWLHGPRAMAFAAWMFVLSPNLLAHGNLATMELPVTLCVTIMSMLFSMFLAAEREGERMKFNAGFWLAGVAGGIGFSCKFTAIAFVPLLVAAWLVVRRRQRQANHAMGRENILLGAVALGLVMLLTNLAVTGFALLPLSERVGNHPSLAGIGAWAGRLTELPIPQDWVGFVTQMRHQRSGGPSYLLGERRMTGWRYYYLVALAVKTPISLWMLLAVRSVARRRIAVAAHGLLIPVVIIGYVALASLGSTRNYGFRYLLPIAPMTIVWISALVEVPRWPRRLAFVGLLGQALAVGLCHPYELSYFNALSGGADGGKYILADSNLDWGQGARLLAGLQRERPELKNITVFYFGATDPRKYGVMGKCVVIDAGELHPGLPPKMTAATPFVAVSTSLTHGPWGPPGYFDLFRESPRTAVIRDRTIAVYRWRGE